MTKIRKNNTIVSGNIPLFSDPPLDKLAQLDRLPVSCTSSNALETLKKRAFAKYYTVNLILPLINLKNDREKSYWNTYYCVSKLNQLSDGKIKAEYCKNRFCIVCNKIRTGILHNTHKKALQTVETRFLTLTTDLTRTCVTKDDLEQAYQIMLKAFQRVWRKTQRKYGKLKALRKTEVTWKFYRGTFHPHFHILIENNSDEAEYLLEQWLIEFPNANKSAQKNKITNEGVFSEVFKYLCKMWDTKKDENGEYKITLPYPVEKMDNIFEVFRGKRTIQSYNLKHVELEEFDDLQATVFTEEIREYDTLWNWEQELKTWIDYDTGEQRTEWKDYSKKEFNSE